VNTAPAKKPKAPRKKRVRLNSYRVWFKDGTSVVMQAPYPNAVLDNLPPDFRMLVRDIVDDV